MFVTWTTSADEPDTVARALEAHLNEFADEIVSVQYAVEDKHYVLVVYRPVDLAGDGEQAVAVAEDIIEEVQT